jgi:hypothetical protein
MMDVLRPRRRVKAVDQERLKRLGRLPGRVLVLELFMMAPLWAHKSFLAAKES